MDLRHGEGKGGLRESWHFQTVISVEPFRGFNVIFGLWIFGLFSLLNKKTAESKWARKRMRKYVKGYSRRGWGGWLSSMTDSISVLAQLIGTWHVSSGGELSLVQNDLCLHPI